ncbi:MAG: hypothetical protein V4697_04145 [Patescibacteria group bacterium]
MKDFLTHPIVIALAVAGVGGIIVWLCLYKPWRKKSPTLPKNALSPGTRAKVNEFYAREEILTDAPRPCKKCGRLVPPGNDAFRLHQLVQGLRTKGVHLDGKSWHLFPTENCEGSPSQLQYLLGQPRDSRPGREHVPYSLDKEAGYRLAYANLQQIYPEKK